MLTMTQKPLMSKVAMMKTSPKSFLGNMDMFRKLPAIALADIERHLVEKRFNKHETIFSEGDAADSVWFVKEGYIKSMHNNPSGRCQMLCMTGPKNMFGSCCAFGQGHYPCNSIAETDTVVVSLPMTDFMGLLGKYPEIGSVLVRVLSDRLRQSKDMQTFEQEPVETRILHVLVNLAKEFGKTIPLTRREIAEMSGTTVETSIRTFIRLEEAGLVSSTRGKITIKDLQLLIGRLEAK